VGEHRDFKVQIGVQVDHSKSLPTDDKLSLNVTVTSHDPLKFLVP